MGSEIQARRGRSTARPTARPAARVAWLLGNDQSPGPGHSATGSAPARTARQGRSSSTTSFTASLTAYAATVPRPVSTDPAIPRGSLRRIAVAHIQTSNIPRITRVPSVATSRSGPSHDGASAAALVTDPYTDAEAPPVTSTGPASPSPPGDSQVTTPAPTPRTANAPSGRPVRTFLRGSRSIKPESRSGNPRGTRAERQHRTLTIVRVDRDGQAVTRPRGRGRCRSAPGSTCRR